MKVFGLFLLATAATFAGCGAAPSVTGSAPDPGITVISPLAGQEATNQLQFLERIRHLPKQAAFERRTFTDSSTKEQMKYLFFKPKNFDPAKTYPLSLFTRWRAAQEF